MILSGMVFWKKNSYPREMTIKPTFFVKIFFRPILKFHINHTLLSDEELILSAINASNQEALGKLYSRYIPMVYGLCLKYLQQQEVMNTSKSATLKRKAD